MRRPTVLGVLAALALVACNSSGDGALSAPGNEGGKTQAQLGECSISSRRFLVGTLPANGFRGSATSMNVWNKKAHEYGWYPLELGIRQDDNLQSSHVHVDGPTTQRCRDLFATLTQTLVPGEEPRENVVAFAVGFPGYDYEAFDRDMPWDQKREVPAAAGAMRLTFSRMRGNIVEAEHEVAVTDLRCDTPFTVEQSWYRFNPGQKPFTPNPDYVAFPEGEGSSFAMSHTVRHTGDGCGFTAKGAFPAFDGRLIQAVVRGRLVRKALEGREGYEVRWLKAYLE